MARKPSKKKLIESIETYGGIITDIAKSIGVTRQTVHNWINADDDLKTAVADCKDELVDLAKKGLRHHLVNNSEKSIHYVLDRLARKEGFGKFLQVKETTVFEDALDDLSDNELLELLVTMNEKLNG